VPLFAPIYENDIGFDATVCRQDDAAIPHALGCLDSFGEIDFAVGYR
jgi:hypothetical protein